MPASTAFTTSVYSALVLFLLPAAWGASPPEGLPAPQAVGSSHMLSMDEVGIMHQLRQALHDAHAVPEQPGWQLNSSAHPCTWKGVTCDASLGHITRLYVVCNERENRGSTNVAAPASGSPASGPGPLLPQLALLPSLEFLCLYCAALRMPGPMPPEWGAPGAFPSLRNLTMTLGSTPGGLPDFQPGSVPRLQHLDIYAPGLRSTLPASWGSPAGVLPSLQVLQIYIDTAGGVPAGWAAGFAQLEQLLISTNASRKSDHRSAPGPHPAPADLGARPQGSGSGSSGAAGGGTSPAPRLLLPPEWGAPGSFPKLQGLDLIGMGLAGRIPDEWAQGGFPALAQLQLRRNNLTGTLPPKLFERHAHLRKLALSMNHFHGTLPTAWNASLAEEIWVDQNFLSGPAFPPSWIAPGGMPRLGLLKLRLNAALTGTFPPSLPWSDLWMLDVEGTAVQGSIPAEWCTAPFAPNLQYLWLLNTSINPTPPPCVQKALPALRIVTLPSDGEPAAEPAPGLHLTVVAAAVAASLAGLLVSVLMLRRRLQPACARDQSFAWVRLEQGQQEEGSPAAAAAAAAGRWRSEGGSGSDRGSGALTVAPVHGQRARLAALLSAQAGRGRRGIALTPISSLPAGLSHRLMRGDMPGGQGAQWHSRRDSSSDRSQQGGEGAVLQHLLGAEDGWGWQGSGPASSSPRWGCSSPAGAAEVWAAEVEAGEAEAEAGAAEAGTGAEYTAAAGAGAAGVSSTAAAERSRRWRLPTDSIRLDSAELEFVVAGKTDEFVELGAGGQAVCYLAKLHSKLVAVKVFELGPGVDSHKAWHEVSLLHTCMHRRIVPLLGVALEANLLMLVMPLMDGGSLASQLQREAGREALRWDACGRQVAVDVAEAVAFLHDRHVLHGDLKPANVLLSRQRRAYLADLGMSRTSLGSSLRPAAGFTRNFAAPEQLLGAACSLAADIYGLGVLLLVLTTRKTVKCRGEWTLPQAPGDCPQSVVALIEQCIQPNPAQRPSAAEVLQQLLADGSSSSLPGATGSQPPGLAAGASATTALPSNSQLQLCSPSLPGAHALAI